MLQPSDDSPAPWAVKSSNFLIEEHSLGFDLDVEIAFREEHQVEEQMQRVLPAEKGVVGCGELGSQCGAQVIVQPRAFHQLRVFQLPRALVTDRKELAAIEDEGIELPRAAGPAPREIRQHAEPLEKMDAEEHRQVGGIGRAPELLEGRLEQGVEPLIGIVCGRGAVDHLEEEAQVHDPLEVLAKDAAMRRMSPNSPMSERPLMIPPSGPTASGR